MSPDQCGYCSTPAGDDAVVLWDDRVYCRTCVESLSPSLYSMAVAGMPLAETIEPRDVTYARAILFVFKMAVGCTLIFAVPLGLVCLFGKANVRDLAALLSFIFGFCILFVSLPAIVGTIALRKKVLPRTLLVEHGQLRVIKANEEWSVSLNDCNWRYGKTDGDAPCFFSGVRRAVMVESPDHIIGCGRTPESLEHWRAFMTLARVPEIPVQGCLRLVIIGIFGMAVGTAVGLGLGHVVALWTQVPIWRFALGFLGAIDGGVFATLRATLYSGNLKAQRARLSPALCGTVFMALGIKIGFVGGWQGGVICALLNGILGTLMGWHFQRVLRDTETDQQFANGDSR